MKLIFQYFDINVYGTFQIRDGKNPQSPELRRLYGEDDVYSTQSYMWVKFYSGARSWFYKSTGFKARFEALDPPGNPKKFCYPGNIYNNNLKLNGSFGTLGSPDERYYPHFSCTWLITVLEGEIIELRFQNFHIPKGSSSKCTPDYVEVLDGKHSSSKSNGRLCGYDTPERIRSSGRYMTVRFRSGETMSAYSGFDATFEAQNVPVEPAASSTSKEVCLPGNPNNENLMLTGTEGTLQTPLEFYPTDLVCVWLIIVPKGKRVELNFERFDISPIGCFDHVQIFDGETDQSPSLEQYCGDSVLQEVRSTGRHMLVRFYSDSESGELHTGFKASFKAISEPKTLIIIVSVLASLMVVVIAVSCYVMCNRRRRNERGGVGGERIPMAPASVTSQTSRPTQSGAIESFPSVGYAPVSRNREQSTHLLSNG